MKFETPKMEISVFSAENVVTASGDIAESQTVEAAQAALTNSNPEITAEKTVVFTF